MRLLLLLAALTCLAGFSGYIINFRSLFLINISDVAKKLQIPLKNFFKFLKKVNVDTAVVFILDGGIAVVIFGIAIATLEMGIVFM